MNNTSGTQGQQPTGPSAATAENLSANMQQMRLDETQTQQNTNTNNVAAAAPAPPNESLLMDLDAENSGWTIVNVRIIIIKNTFEFAVSSKVGT